MPETVICACASSASDGRSAGDGRGAVLGMVPGGYTGVGTGEGYTGVLPSCSGRGPSDSEAGPEGSCREPGVVVTGSPGVPAPGPPTPGPCRTLRGPLRCPGTSLEQSRLLANNGEIQGHILET